MSNHLFAVVLAAIIVAVISPASSLELGANVTWSKAYGGPYGDGAWYLQQTEDGGYILVGNTATRGQESDLWAIKTDQDGNLVWDKTFGGSGEDIGYFVHETKDGDFVIVGSTESYGMGEERLWLLKIDGNGSEIWSRIFGGFVSSSGDGGWSLDETEEGGYIISGYTQSQGLGRKDLWLLKTDDQGKVTLDKTYGGTEDDVGMSIIQTANGNFVISGRTSSFGKGGDDIWLMKIDSKGDEVWNTTFGGKKDDAAFQVVELLNGYALVGRTESGSDNTRIILIRTDSMGNKIWEKVYRGSSGTSLHTTSDGGFVIIGRIDDEKSGRDALIIKTDPLGKEEWSIVLGGERDDIGTALIESMDGAIVFAGITDSKGQGAEDAWLVKLQPSQIDLAKKRTMQNLTNASVITADKPVLSINASSNDTNKAPNDANAYQNASRETNEMAANVTLETSSDDPSIKVLSYIKEKGKSKRTINDLDTYTTVADLEKSFRDRLR